MPGSSEAPGFRDAPDRVKPPKNEAPVNASSTLELFGAHQSRPEQQGTVPFPPYIRGPVHHFARLDIDKDGQITAEDLEWLARPIYLDVRLSAVIAALDTDDDGGVSPEEFDASMR